MYSVFSLSDLNSGKQTKSLPFCGHIQSWLTKVVSSLLPLHLEIEEAR